MICRVPCICYKKCSQHKYTSTCAKSKHLYIYIYIYFFTAQFHQLEKKGFLGQHTTPTQTSCTINFRENFQHFTATYFSIKFDHPNTNFRSHLPSREQLYLTGTSKIINTKLPFNGIWDKFPVEG